VIITGERSDLAAKYWTCSRQGAGSATTSNLKKVANLLCAQAGATQPPTLSEIGNE